MTPVLETARLLLRPLELVDAEQIQQVFPQWEVVRYLTDTIPWPYPKDGALALQLFRSNRTCGLLVFLAMLVVGLTAR